MKDFQITYTSVLIKPRFGPGLRYGVCNAHTIDEMKGPELKWVFLFCFFVLLGIT